MLYTVEVRRIGADLAASMAEMRTWFDHHQISPAVFDHSSGGPGITFRVGCSQEDDAVAFARAFRGWFKYGTDPGGVALWQIPRPGD
jgi:hypothetical protein